MLHPCNKRDYSKRPVIKEIIGLIRLEIAEVPFMGRIRKIRIIVPHCCITVWNSRAMSAGKKPVTIFSPSRGATGTRLKTAREILRVMIGIKMRLNNESTGNILSKMANKLASIRLDTGPASEMIAASLLGLRKL